MTRIRKAIFPVAGLGTRFLPATKAMPKEMLPVVDRPLIQHVVDEARQAGIEHFIFVTGRNKSVIEDHFDRQFSYISVSRMLLAPLPVDIGLDRHLANSLGLPVQSFDLADVLDFPGAPELRDPTRQSYRLHIIGAALRDERVAS